MDDQSLRDATDRWLEEGLIDRETAAAIREHERDRGDETDSTGRFTTIIAGMGAALVGAGILAFVGANWADIGDGIRTFLLLAAPIILAAAGVLLDRRGLPRAGLGTWVLAAIMLGPSLLLLGDIHVPGLDTSWLVLAWGVLAVPMGHAFVSRLATAVGLVAFLLAGLLAGDGHTGVFLAAGLGGVMLGAGIPLRDRRPTLVDAYHVVGVGGVILAFLWVNTMEGRFDRIAVTWDAGLIGVLLLATVIFILTLVGFHRQRVWLGEAVLVGVPPVSMLVVLALIETSGALPAIAGYLAVQAILLLVLIAVVVAALLLESKVLVNLAVIGFFLQILTLLATVTDALSGAVALIIVGITLVLVAIGLERGRRHLIDRLGRRQGVS